MPGPALKTVLGDETEGAGGRGSQAELPLEGTGIYQYRPRPRFLKYSEAPLNQGTGGGVGPEAGDSLFIAPSRSDTSHLHMVGR